MPKPKCPRCGGKEWVPLPHRGRYAAYCRKCALEVDMARLQVRKRAPLALDLSAIAKGYGVDQLAHCLDGHGIASYLVGIDGVMRARAAKPGGDAWAVAIEKPVTPTAATAPGDSPAQRPRQAARPRSRRWFDGTRLGSRNASSSSEANRLYRKHADGMMIRVLRRVSVVKKMRKITVICPTLIFHRWY